MLRQLAIRTTLATALAASTLLSGCAMSPQFHRYEGDPTPRQGQGGAKTVVDGMEVWTHGEPPRRYRIVGYLEVLQSFDTDAVAVTRARQAGGDALLRGALAPVAEGVFEVRYTVIQFAN